MVISMSPIQFSLETDVPGMGGFCYKDLLKTNLIDYFVGQFYTDFTLEAYKECVNNGYPAEKLVIGMISGQDFGDNLDAISLIKKEYPKFGGVSVWAYFNAPLGNNGTSYNYNPNIWCQIVRKFIS